MEHKEIPRNRENSYDKIDQTRFMRRPKYDNPLNSYSFLNVRNLILSKPGRGLQPTMLSSEECAKILEHIRNEDITD